MRSRLPSFIDELNKIANAGDLMNPAVVSDSAVVDGPPATPFTRRKGYKKLETPVQKEAGVDLRALARQSKRMGQKAVRVPRVLSIQAYTRAPQTMRDMYENVAMNPSDWAGTPGTFVRLARQVFGG